MDWETFLEVHPVPVCGESSGDFMSFDGGYLVTNDTGHLLLNRSCPSFLGGLNRGTKRS